jgi:hypothetical protein
MELILTRQETKRLKAIIVKQNKVKQKAAERSNQRTLYWLNKKSSPKTPEIKRGVRIKDKHVLQILLGSLSDRNLDRYSKQGMTRELAKEIIETRPSLMAKYEAIVLGLQPIGG